MAITNTRITTTDPTSVFLATATEAITVVYICNTSSSTVVVDVYCINGDDSSAGSLDNIIYSQLAITANDTYVIDTEKLILNANDELDVETDTPDSITVTVSSIVV